MKLILVFAISALSLLAQNPNPCSQIRNQAKSGQVLSAAAAGATPPCQWITGGGGGGSGTVTNIATTLPIQGGPITTTGTISCRTATGSVSGCLSAEDWTTFNNKVSSIRLTVGTTPVDSGTGSAVLYNNLGVLGNYAVSGTGGVCMTTNCSLTTANLNTPSAINLTNATNLPCGALPALTGDVTSSAGSCATTIANDAVTTVKILNANVTAAKMVNAGVFTGDVTTTFPAITVTKVNGVSSAASPANHTVQVVTASNTRTDKVVPDCTDTGGNHLNFTQSTDAFSCGTGGGMVLLEQYTASSQANVSFTTCLANSNFDDFEFRIQNAIPATGATGDNLIMTFSTNGGSTYLSTNYGYGLIYSDSTGASGTVSSGGVTAAAFIQLNENFPTAAAGDGGISVYVNLALPANTTAAKHVKFRGYNINGSDSRLYQYDGAGANSGTGAINAVRFAFNNSINITSGIFRCYGIAK